jgi:predicted RNase H-like nuclease (RuvC/YqgF family)
MTNAIREASDGPEPCDRSDYDMDDLRLENHRLRAGLEQMRDEVLRLGRALEPMHRLNEEISTLHAEVERLSESGLALRACVDRSDRELQTQRQHAEYLAGELRSVYASSSWRLTGPLRWLARGLLRKMG